MQHNALPCHAVIFTSIRTRDNGGYQETATHMLELAHAIPGFLGVDAAREDVGIAVSYHAWGAHPAHKAAQRQGRVKWHASSSTRICRVERQSDFSAALSHGLFNSKTCYLSTFFHK